MEKIFQDSSFKEWQDAAVKMLKGKAYDTLISHTEDEIDLQPIYTNAQPQYSSPLWTDTQREIKQTFYVNNKEFGRTALNALQNGQNALNINLDPYCQLGINRHSNQMVDGFVKMADETDVDKLLSGLSLEKTALHLNALDNAPALYRLLKKYSFSNKISISNVHLGADPIGAALLYGGLSQPLEIALDKICTICNDSPLVQSIFTIDTTIIHNAGGHKRDELSYFAALLGFYINNLEKKGIDPKGILPLIRVKVAVGNDHFAEMAKIRAVRLLWTNICLACNCRDIELKIDAQTSWRSMTAVDVHSNIIRSSAQVFAAICGGCNTIDVIPFDLPLGLPTEKAVRLARNTALVTLQEAHLDKIADPAPGSYYLDTLSAQLAEKSWESFLEMEKAGGIDSLIESGLFQKEIETKGKKQSAALKTNRKTVIGVNAWQNRSETMPKNASADILYPKVNPSFFKYTVPMLKLNRLSVELENA